MNNNKNVVFRDPPGLLETHPQAGSGALAAYHAAFLRQFNPADVVELVLTRDLARNAARMDTLAGYHAALNSQGGAALVAMLGQEAGDTSSSAEATTAIVAASPHAESIFRQELAAARGFQRALQVLHRWQAGRGTSGTAAEVRFDPRFQTEQACSAYLVRRFQDGTHGCRKCDRRGHGRFVATRLCWECGECGGQTGLRVGTVMEDSALPLMKWFKAIRLLLLRPGVATAELSETLEIGRAATVRAIAKKIRAAVRAEDASMQLAGLDLVFLDVT
jgi:hypothetical protein